MSFLTRIVFLVPVVLGLSLVSYAQSDTSIEWRGVMVPPKSGPVDVGLDVVPAGDSVKVYVNLMQRRIPVLDARFSDTALSYVFRPTLQIYCRLLSNDDQVFRGGCLDERGGLGLIALARSDVSVTQADLDSSIAAEVFADQDALPWQQDVRTLIDAAEKTALAGRLVELPGGASVHAYESGAGSLTVVFESGAGDDLQVWSEVIGLLSRSVRVLAYDRSGVGRSTPTGRPRTPRGIADDLQAVLQATDVSGPIVLVAHAEASFWVREYAALGNADVAGLILIDPYLETFGSNAAALSLRDEWSAYLKQAAGFAQILPDPTGQERIGAVEILSSEQFHGAATIEVPVVVVGARGPLDGPGGSFVQQRSGRAMLRRAQREWVEQLPNALYLESSSPLGYVHQTDPATVVRAIRMVVHSLETGSKLTDADSE